MNRINFTQVKFGDLNYGDAFIYRRKSDWGWGQSTEGTALDLRLSLL